MTCVQGEWMCWSHPVDCLYYRRPHYTSGQGLIGPPDKRAASSPSQQHMGALRALRRQHTLSDLPICIESYLCDEHKSTIYFPHIFWFDRLHAEGRPLRWKILTLHKYGVSQTQHSFPSTAHKDGKITTIHNAQHILCESLAKHISTTFKNASISRFSIPFGSPVRQHYCRVRLTQSPIYSINIERGRHIIKLEIKYVFMSLPWS